MANNDRETSQPTCQNCTTSTTPLWRRDEIGSVLCNACGLFLKLHGRPRPISLKTDVIKSRNRVKSSGSAQSAKKKVRQKIHLIIVQISGLITDAFIADPVRSQCPRTSTITSWYTTTRFTRTPKNLTKVCEWTFRGIALPDLEDCYSFDVRQPCTCFQWAWAGGTSLQPFSISSTHAYPTTFTWRCTSGISFYEWATWPRSTTDI